MTTVSAVIVTHNSSRWLEETLHSIENQSRPPDQVVVVDDNSTDSTLAILRARGITAFEATSRSADRVTRIAANFVQGVRACADADLVALSDHDDRWFPDRIAHQVAVLSSADHALMVASDGATVDADGASLGSSIRQAFPLPDDWHARTPAARMRYVLRHSVATGGASMIRPGKFPELDVPQGWLHDRWWSLVAVARGGLLIDEQAVIEYRVQPGQQVGLDVAAQAHGPFGRAAALLAQVRRSYRKQHDLRTRLRPLAADPSIAAAITVRNVL